MRLEAAAHEAATHAPRSPAALRDSQLLALQRVAGNRAVAALVAREVTPDEASSGRVAGGGPAAQGGAAIPAAGGGGGLDREAAGASLRRGAELAEAGQLEAAIVEFERARMQDPSLRNPLWNLGVSNFRLARYATAAAYFEAYAAHPEADAAAASAALAQARAAAGIPRIREVEEPTGGAAARRRERAGQILGLGNTAALSGDLLTAIRHYERARELDPTLRNTWWNLGVCNVDLGRYATAAYYFEHYAALPNADASAGSRAVAQARAWAGLGGVREDEETGQAATGEESAVGTAEAQATAPAP